MTDKARIDELNNRVANAYSKTPTDAQHAVDLALARLSANTEILSKRGTPTNR